MSKFQTNFGPNDISDIRIRTIIYLKNAGFNGNLNTFVITLDDNNKYVYSNWDFNISIPQLSDLQLISESDLKLEKLLRNFKFSQVSIYTTDELNTIANNISLQNGSIAFNSDLLKGVIFFNGAWF